MNPYESDPSKIPPGDPYADVPYYGRYGPTSDDFIPNPPPGSYTRPDVIEYWDCILRDKCTDANRLYCIDGWRDVFSLGSIIVKSSHLQTNPPIRNYGSCDANEVLALTLVTSFLRDINIEVPTILFQGKIKNNDVMVQTRIPGVGLNVAWPYLSLATKTSIKEQARDILRKLVTLPSSLNLTVEVPTYVIPDPDPMANRGISQSEYDILFMGVDNNLGFTHNDFDESNIIIRDDRIVALIDWEMAGFFGLSRAGKVHAAFRTEKKESLQALGWTEEKAQDLSFWNDLYEGL